jgi:hypothetical protein
MPRFFFFPVLDALNNGKVIRTSVSIALRVLAVLAVLSGAYLLIEILKVSFQLPTEGTVGGLLFAVLFAASVLAVGQIFWYRAHSVEEIGESPFTVIPIVSILFRLLGELYATLGLMVGLGGCLFIWLAKANPLGLVRGMAGLLPSFSGEATFLGGLMFLGYLGFAAFLALIVFYALAEWSVVLVDISRNVRALSRPGQAAGASAAH